MLIFNFNILVLLAVFVGIMPIQSSANEPIKVPPPPKASPLKTEILTIKKQTGEEIPINAELALTPVDQARGLMFRTEMPEDSGMLFVFKDEAPRSFWMKNTLIPLDIIFIKRSGEILHIHENAIPQDLTSIPSKGNAYAVLELNGGASKKLGLSAGDTIKHAYFGMVLPR